MHVSHVTPDTCWVEPGGAQGALHPPGVGVGQGGGEGGGLAAGRPEDPCGLKQGGGVMERSTWEVGGVGNISRSRLAHNINTVEEVLL